MILFGVIVQFCGCGSSEIDVDEVDTETPKIGFAHCKDFVTTMSFIQARREIQRDLFKNGKFSRRYWRYVNQRKGLDVSKEFQESVEETKTNQNEFVNNTFFRGAFSSTVVVTISTSINETIEPQISVRRLSVIGRIYLIVVGIETFVAYCLGVILCLCFVLVSLLFMPYPYILLGIIYLVIGTLQHLELIQNKSPENSKLFGWGIGMIVFSIVVGGVYAFFTDASFPQLFTNPAAEITGWYYFTAWLMEMNFHTISMFRDWVELFTIGQILLFAIGFSWLAKLIPSDKK
jgi:hypothetical protein